MRSPTELRTTFAIRPAPPDRGQRRTSTVRAGVFGACILILCLAGLSSLGVAPFRSPDESAHVAYAVSIGHGTIPRKDEPGPRVIPGEHADRIYTADHPPLFYILITGPLLLGIHTGHPLLGLHLARFESILFSTGTVILTAALAGILLGGRRPEVAVTSAAVVATLGAFDFTSSQVYNDSLGALLSLSVLLATLLALRDGLRTGRCLLIVLTATLAIATRASNAEIVALAAAGLVAAGAVHDTRRWRGAAVGALWVGVMGAVCFAAVGWFYLLNQSRYGHLTGRTQLWLAPRSVSSFLLSPSSYVNLGEQTFANLAGVEHRGVLPWMLPTLQGGVIAIWSLTGVGLLWWLRHRPRLRPPRVSQLLMLLVVVHALAGLLYVAWWVHLGGRPNVRYLFPALPVVAVALARAVAGLPGGRFWAVLVVTMQFVMSAGYLAKLPAQWAGTGLWRAYPAALDQAGVPAPAVVTIGLLIGAIGGWLLCTRAILTVAPAEPDS
ncbi:MAG TPA: hypothetical protein VHC49_08810 [Mycobacteriales bacterium]|nr:hypothetical protein [Mycobacteriales bacterium]